MTREQRIEAQRKRTIEWLDKKSPKGMTCPICSQMVWTIGEVAELRSFEGGTLVIGGNSSTYPVVPVICRNCGYTMFINAAISQIVQKSDYQQDTEVGPDNG